MALISILPISLSAEEDQIVRAVCLVRHGERTPWSGGYAKLERPWKEAPGELTAKGGDQVFRLGTQYADRYIKQLRLLEPRYSPGSIQVVSTGVNRTFVSAKWLLCGLYSPGPGVRDLADIQGIPIRTLPQGQKPNLLSKELEDAPLFYRNIDKLLKTSEFEALNKEHQTDLERWGKMVGASQPIKNAWELLGLSDYLFCLLQVTPATLLPDGLSTAEANRIIDTGFTNEARLCSTPLMTRFMAHDFMKQLCADLDAASKNPPQCKLTLYVGHDISILPVMAALGSPLATNPPYAAHLEFELYQSEAGVHRVKAFYQNSRIAIAGKENPTLVEFNEAVQWVIAAP